MENEAVEPIVFRQKREHRTHVDNTAFNSHGKGSQKHREPFERDKQSEYYARAQQLSREILERKKSKSYQPRRTGNE